VDHHLRRTTLSERLSGLEVDGGEVLAVEAAHADGEKCARCWNWRPDVGARTPEVCGRCASVLAGEVDS